MSVRVMSWVFTNSVSRGTDRLVLLAIADSTNDAGCEAWPSLSTIASKAGVDRRTVMRSLDRLEELGELERVKFGGRPGHGGTSNSYRVCMTSPQKQGQSAPRGGESLGAACHEVGQRVTQVGARCHPIHPYPSEPSAARTIRLWTTWPRFERSRRAGAHRDRPRRSPSGTALPALPLHQRRVRREPQGRIRKGMVVQRLLHHLRRDRVGSGPSRGSDDR